MTAELKITDITKENLSMDGVKWDECRITIDVKITSNIQLSNLLNSIRYLRGGSPK